MASDDGVEPVAKRRKPDSTDQKELCGICDEPFPIVHQCTCSVRICDHCVKADFPCWKCGKMGWKQNVKSISWKESVTERKNQPTKDKIEMHVAHGKPVAAAGPPPPLPFSSLPSSTGTDKIAGCSTASTPTTEAVDRKLSFIGDCTDPKAESGQSVSCPGMQ